MRAASGSAERTWATEEQYELLREMGCDLGRGAFFAEPFPATALDGRLGVG